MIRLVPGDEQIPFSLEDKVFLTNKVFFPAKNCLEKEFILL
jgi:hypothetical protein